MQKGGGKLKRKRAPSMINVLKTQIMRRNVQSNKKRRAGRTREIGAPPLKRTKRDIFD